MTLYNPIDDDVDEDDSIHFTVDVPEDRVLPDGAFSRDFNGVKVWFTKPKPYQMNALNRLRASSLAEMKRIQNSGLPEAEQYAPLAKLSWDFDGLCIDLIESLLVDKDQANVLASMQLRGELSPQELIAKVLFEDGEDEPEDDEPPRPKAVKKTAKAARPVKKATAAAKKTANAGRTKR